MFKVLFAFILEILGVLSGILSISIGVSFYKGTILQENSQSYFWMAIGAFFFAFMFAWIANFLKEN